MEIKDMGDGDLPVDTHFGPGMLTFYPGYVFRTEPGYNLYITGPSNLPKDGIYPLTAVMETDWASTSFSMTWMVTRKDCAIRFDKGEPFCRFFPLQRSLIESVEPELTTLDRDPHTKERFEQWRENRRSVLSSEHDVSWDKTYMKGIHADGRPGAPDHQSKLNLKSFQVVDELP
ncbi:MAG: hypothetical protein KDC35_06515 [Acidobacteria bacterium]|nr:hypothetical protein [Acidobacteriota bacterium]